MPWRAVKHACYRESRAHSAALGSMLVMHRMLGTWQSKVARYIALNEFCKNKFIEGGLPADRIAVKPNFVDCEVPLARPRTGFLFVGRLSPEKGIDVLARAASEISGLQLRVAGTGPAEYALNGVPGVERLGALAEARVREEMSGAVALVLPSIWYENFPRTLVEAFACGLPVIASRIGALAELVEDGVTGLLFTSGDPLDLASKIRWAQASPDKMAAMGRTARTRFEGKYTPQRNYAQLLEIYSTAILRKDRQ